MKKLLLLAALLCLTNVFAEDASDKAVHDSHHTKAAKSAKMTGMAMDKSQMNTMMGECMNKNKDNKMCSDEMMNKCHQSMSKKECAKMMKDMKGDMPAHE